MSHRSLLWVHSCCTSSGVGRGDTELTKRENAHVCINYKIIHLSSRACQHEMPKIGINRAQNISESRFFMTTRSPDLDLTVCNPIKRTLPLFLASRRDCSETRDAVPPMWKVRIVSWVPGSPMDCAAMTPVASPSSTRRPEARLRP